MPAMQNCMLSAVNMKKLQGGAACAGAGMQAQVAATRLLSVGQQAHHSHQYADSGCAGPAAPIPPGLPQQ